MGAAWDAWLADDSAAGLNLDFRRFGAGAGLESCPVLEDIFAGSGQAEALMQALASQLCKVMADRPFAHPPFRHGFKGSASSLLLAKSGRAQLLLQAREPGEYLYPAACFTHSLRYEAVLAGCGKGVIARICGGQDAIRYCDEEVRLQRGVRLAFDCASESMLVTEVDRRLVTLRLEKTAADPRPGREYCRTSGRLLQQAAGSLATSRREMMTALLGRMHRSDAAPVLADMAHREKDESLRWQALRECLALDSARGFCALSAIARNPQDTLSAAAGALRAQLVEAHPQLLELERN